MFKNALEEIADKLMYHVVGPAVIYVACMEKAIRSGHRYALEVIEDSK